jgi:uncharacterized protein with LGFP repeats
MPSWVGKGDLMSDPHEHDEDPEDCIGEPVRDPWNEDGATPDKDVADLVNRQEAFAWLDGS